MHALLDPPGLGEALALRTVPIAARVAGRALEAAPRAQVDLATQGGCPADGDRAQRLPLLTRERLALPHRAPWARTIVATSSPRGDGPVAQQPARTGRATIFYDVANDGSASSGLATVPTCSRDTIT